MPGKYTGTVFPEDPLIIHIGLYVFNRTTPEYPVKSP